jgi:hypothetical protein
VPEDSFHRKRVIRFLMVVILGAAEFFSVFKNRQKKRTVNMPKDSELAISSHMPRLLPLSSQGENCCGREKRRSLQHQFLLEND